jgi:hypothetical protein
MLKNTFRERQYLFPKRDSIPNANAISVAIGIPIPGALVYHSLKKINSSRISNLQPAPNMGNKASLILDSSPL